MSSSPLVPDGDFEEQVEDLEPASVDGEENFEIRDGGAQDTLDPETSSVHLPPPARFLLCLTLCERLSYHSATVVLPKYGDVMFNLSEKSGDVIATAFVAYVFLSSMFGGYLSDSRLGRSTTITYSAIFCMIGLLILFLSALPFSWKEYPDDPSPGFAVPGFIIGLALSGIGIGGLKSSLAPFFGDQIGTSNLHLYGPAYRWYYWIVSIGAFTGILCAPMLNRFDVTPSSAPESSEGTSYWASFLLPFCSYLASAALFMVIRWRFVVHQPKRGLISAIKSTLAYEKKAESSDESSSTQGTWLRHSISSEEHKETARDMRGFRSIVIYLACTYPCFWLTRNTVLSTLDEQAEIMDRPNWMEAKHLQCSTPALLVLMVPLLEWWVFKRLIEKRVALQPQKRIPVGFVLLAVAAVYVAVLQLVINSNGTWKDEAYTTTSPLSVWLQVPAFPLIALSELLAVASGLEYIFIESPSSMLSMSNGMFMLMVSLGTVLHLFVILKITDEHQYITLFTEAFLMVMVSVAVKYSKEQPLNTDIELSTAALIDDDVESNNLSLNLAEAE